MTLQLDDTPLSRVLLKDIVDCSSTRNYQQVLDKWVDATRGKWDAHTGAYKSEVHGGGRAITAPLSQIAFCYYSPLSRHQGDTELLNIFKTGLCSLANSIREDGIMGCYGLNGTCWAHGWDIEGLIFGMHFCKDSLDSQTMESLQTAFTRSARRHANLERTPEIIGSYGNQRVVWTLGLHLYGQILADETLITLSDQFFYEALDKVLDPSGQVIEQQGPCLNYSSVAFFYAWLNLVIRGDTNEDDRILRCLRWFRDRHTNSFQPMAGPSARNFKEGLSDTIGDLLPAAEHVAYMEPSARTWVLDAMDCLVKGGTAQRVTGHGGSALMWAILLTSDSQKTSKEPAESWDAPSIICYDRTHLLKRFPMKYVLARQRYQTHFSFHDYLPFSGIQTWALDDEPPIIHPTPLAPSTTQAYGLDTARQGASHNWGGFGAGAVGIDGYLRSVEKPEELPLLLARYDWFWRLVVFTELSTVVFEFGDGGSRVAFWTLNRLAPTQPTIRPGVVTFADRAACLHTTLREEPELITLTDNHKWATGVQQLKYDCGDSMTAFALSDASFSFGKDFHFSDATGHYRVIPDPRLLSGDNPGHFSIDTWELAQGTVALKA